VKRIHADIGDHLMDRVRQLIEDTVDTCGHADMTLKETRAVIASVMACAFAEACSEFRMPREVFMHLCEIAYEGREPKARRKRKAPGRGA
jgi:hypothetical protein